jgi:hypothetical protein
MQADLLLKGIDFRVSRSYEYEPCCGFTTTELVSIMIRATIRMDRQNMRVRSVRRQHHGDIVNHGMG